VAEEARFQMGADTPLRVMALLDARMDEVYAACYAFDGTLWRQHGDYSLCKPEDVRQLMPQDTDWQIAGNAHTVYGARLPLMATPPVQALPTAAAMLRLAPALLASGCAVPGDQALPTYIRDKVAKTTLERQVEKAAMLAQ
jgi:tRNA threonylcarbamoyladenosine biosynthesis protein TsaB